MYDNRKCAYCGNNPVPHFANWFFESLNLLLTSIRTAVLFNPFSKILKGFFSKFDFFEKFINLLSFLKVIKWESDKSKCKIQRAVVLWEDGEKKGLKMSQAIFLKKPIDIYKAVNLKRTLIFSGLPRPKNYDNSSLDWMDDKFLLKRKLSDSGLPVPMGGSVWNFYQAKKIFENIQKTRNPQPATNLPVIVKPRAGSRGRHSTTFVSDIGGLKKAYKIAKQLCFWVIVEEQLTGPVYRATLINYELCGVLRGDSPQVIGDGEHTIRELVKIKNNIAHPGVKDIVADEGMERFVERQIPNSKFQIPNQPLTLIPSKGENVKLSEKIGVSYGGSSSEDFDICHEDNKQLFIHAAKIVSDPIVGFDFIIPDITKSWKEQKCGFIEANSLPFINLHHDPLHGTPRNVAEKVWDMMGHFKDSKIY